MKKSKKILIIIGVILVALLIAAYVTLFVLYPVQTKQWTLTAWDWLNEPLPIIGVSTLMILFFAWKVFANSSFGKKQINVFKEQTQKIENDFNTIKNQWDIKENEYKEKLNKAQQEIEKYKQYLVQICDLIPNKKVKELGETINGKETINN